MTIVVDIEWVNAVLDTYLVTEEQFAVVGEWALRLVGRSHADTTTPLATPLRLSVVEYVLAANAVDVRGPETTLGNHLRTGFGRKGRPDVCPVYQILRLVYRQIADAFRGIQVVVPVVGLDDGWVGQGCPLNRVGITIVGRVIGGNRKCGRR